MVAWDNSLAGSVIFSHLPLFSKKVNNEDLKKQRDEKKSANYGSVHKHQLMLHFLGSYQPFFVSSGPETLIVSTSIRKR